MKKLKDLYESLDNPRVIDEKGLEGIALSVATFPKMLSLREIVTEGGAGKGGNQRIKAIKLVVERGIEWIKAQQPDHYSETRKEFNIKFWEEVIKKQALPDWALKDFKSKKDLPFEFEEEEIKEFVIKDNVNAGLWDYEALRSKAWGVMQAEAWGVDFPELTATEKLSVLKFENVYYEPIEKPEISLSDCLDLGKFEAKVKALDEYELSEDQKEVLKMFAYRFIKIDFESVANYYFFNATEEEKKAIERLRLVLSDNGLNGFIADDILKIHETIESWNDD